MRSKCLLLVKIQIQNLGLKKKWGVKQIFLAAIYVMLLVMLASYSFGVGIWSWIPWNGKNWFPRMCGHTAGDRDILFLDAEDERDIVCL